jgi:hypothetical protein
MRLEMMMCALVIGCGGEIGQPDAAGSDGGGVTIDGGRRCARASDCDDGLFCNGSEDCVDTLCVRGAPPCDAVAEQCDEVGASCSAIECTPDVADVDDDLRRSGACGGDDCDDSDGNRYPGNHEVCDTAGHDEDCDPETFGVRDLDMDGEPDAACCNGDVCGSDCDDARANVSPRAPEVCGNGLDDDCDGDMDEELLVDGFADADGDGWGDSTIPMSGVCPGTPGFAAMGGDCDESSPALNPGATEACDMIDNDCDGVADDGLPTMRCYRDADGDGHGLGSVFETRCSCGSGWSALPDDCADRTAGAHPEASWRTDVYCPDGFSCIIGTGIGDWNCDEVEERRYTRNCSLPCDMAGLSPGCWSGGQPGCGASATWRECASGGSATFTTRQQECR